MNILLKKALSSVLTASLFHTAVNFAAPLTVYAAGKAASEDGSAKTELNSADIKFEYVTATYNGKPQTPKITVRSGGKELTENVDFNVQYPDDVVNVGLKTVSISGLGSYSGNFSATYRIDPLNVSDPSVLFIATASSCTYNGFSVLPNFQITVNGLNVSENSYSKKFTNNVSVTKKAVCEFTFNGNFIGTRSAEFAITKSDHSDLDIEVPLDLSAAGGAYKFTYDLSELLPQGAHFGAPAYSSRDFPREKPTIAFNELNCTVCEGISSPVVTIPVAGADNYSDYSINFYFVNSQKIKPQLTLKPIIHEYDGEPVTEDEIVASGSFATVNGEKISGEWIFWSGLSAEPHSAIPVVCTFRPDDPAYESVDGIISVTVNKVQAPEFTVRLSNESINRGGESILTVSGVPDELIDLLRIEISPSSDEFYFQDYPSKTLPRFMLTFPFEKEIYTVTVSLPEDEHRFAGVASAKINVGNYVPPEQEGSEKVTSEDELMEMISKASTNGFIMVHGMKTISKAALQAASEKKLMLEDKLSDSYIWVLNTLKIPENLSSLNLELGSASIPSVLIEKIGGTAANSFTVNEKNLSNFSELRVTLKNPQKDKFANLFYYNSTGELEFCSSARIEPDNTVKLPIGKSGKFVVITDNETKLFGDINNDCKFNLSDLTELIQIYANNLSTPEQLTKHDINEDGVFRLDDITELLNIYANMH